MTTAAGTSELSAVVRKIVKDGVRNEAPVKQNTKQLTVHLPTLESVNIQVAEKTSVEDVIKVAIQQYEIECSDKKRVVRMNMDPKAYVLRWAEDDGVPDEDLPGTPETPLSQKLKFCKSSC